MILVKVACPVSVWKFKSSNVQMFNVQRWVWFQLLGAIISGKYDINDLRSNYIGHWPEIVLMFKTPDTYGSFSVKKIVDLPRQPFSTIHVMNERVKNWHALKLDVPCLTKKVRLLCRRWTYKRPHPLSTLTTNPISIELSSSSRIYYLWTSTTCRCPTSTTIN